MPISTYAAIFFGGGVGAVSRYAVGNLTGRLLGVGFPYGTLAVNLFGALLIGVLLELMALKFSAPHQWRLFLVTGFLGGFTTFSAFSLEAALMLQRGNYREMIAYVLISVIGTVALVMGGAWMVREIA